MYLWAPYYSIWTTDRETIWYDAQDGNLVEVEQRTTIPVTHCEVINQVSGTDGSYEYWTRPYPYTDAPLTEALQDAIDDHDGLFTLLINAFLDSQPDRYLWNINPNDVSLEISYQPAESQMIDSVLITNVVDGIRDWDLLPQSRVRGDTNALISGTRYADYTMLPPFEPPAASRSWLTWRYHLTETWFAKFEHASFSGRRKFRHWNDQDAVHGVVSYTDLWSGKEMDYRAVADTVFQTRNLIKREITAPYTGLSFDFKDPWRVAQNLNAGGPDSTQFILDGYIEQYSPYEPWTDSLSWGVFTGVTKEDNPHYATRYSRYYDYDAGSDSYSRKESLPLGEGDLIHMDEISQGKGIEISPAGSIEYSDATTPGATYRDYSVEYKDGSQTMDLTGVFKAHLLSNKEDQPTRSANQRKLDIDPDSVYHMVYESAGEVWYTQSEDGSVWSPEELVSSYTHSASNASLAVLDSSVYVTYFEDGIIILRRRYKGTWYSYDLEDNCYYTNGVSTTPVVAAAKTCYADQGDIVLLVWDADEYLQYNMLYLYYSSVYVDTINGLYQTHGQVALNATDYPVFPAITSHDDLKFTVAWREGRALQAAEIEVGGGSCDYRKFLTDIFVTPLPEVTLPYDSCIYAPSITTDHQEKPVVAYEVKRPSIIYSDRWVNVRTYDYSSGSWNTTLYQLPFYQWTQYGDPIAPSIGAHTTSSYCGGGDLQRGLRVAFHQNWGGGIRVGKFDCSYSTTDQLTNGESFPSVVPFAPNGLLREAFSAPYQTGPFEYALRTTNTALTKSCVPDMRLVRDLRIGVGSDVAILGITNLSVLHGNTVRDEITWFEVSDTLVAGVDGDVHELLRTTPFTIDAGDRFEYQNMLFCSDANEMPSGVSAAVQLRRASDDAILQQFALPLRSFPADTAIWYEWSRNLSAFKDEHCYISLGVQGTLPGGASISTAKVWMEGQYIPKPGREMNSSQVQPETIWLGQNHPNPFKGTTSIPFTLPSLMHITLSVYDVMGREVARIADEELPAGEHVRSFEADGLPPGSYILKLATERNTISKTMMLIK
jgi:hypothetical protein